MSKDKFETLGLAWDSEKDLGIIGILVCQPQDVLDHKLKDGKSSEGRYCFWKFGERFPRRIRQTISDFVIGSTGTYSEAAKAPDEEGCREDDLYLTNYSFYVRFYFAVGGVVQGYFEVYRVDSDLTELRFHSEDWVPIKDGAKIRPSQGYRYYDMESKVTVNLQYADGKRERFKLLNPRKLSRSETREVLEELGKDLSPKETSEKK